MNPSTDLGRRGFLLSAGRWLLLGVAGLTGGLALRGRRPSATVGSECPPGGTCDGCPDRDGCGDPRARSSAVAAGRQVWQLDPEKCVQCGRCAVNCVLTPSAVKCVHNFRMCGYCRLCFGFFQPGAVALDEAAENQMCPTGALARRFVEEPYFEYRVDEARCVGCGKCVKGCVSFGNGSLQLQARHDRCLNCNECSIARNCPAGAWRRVPADRPYLLRGTA